MKQYSFSLQDDYNKKLSILKKRLTSFSPISNHTHKCSKEEIMTIDAQEIPFSSTVGAFLFGKVLEIEMHVGEMEKFYNVLFFEYKGYSCNFIDHKGSFTMDLPVKYQDEILSTLRNVHSELSELIFLYAKIQIETHQNALENRYTYYKNKSNWLESQIERERLNSNCESCVVKANCEEIFEQYGQRVCDVFRSRDYALCYCIDCYIDNFYSMMEHLFTLLTPFHPNYDPEVEEHQQPEKFKIRCKRWKEKAEALALGDEQALNCIQQLQYYKDIYRNYVTHGMFSSEYNVLVNIGACGLTPVTVGNKYLKGLNDRKGKVVEYKDY